MEIPNTEINRNKNNGCQHTNTIVLNHITKCMTDFEPGKGNCVVLIWYFCILKKKLTGILSTKLHIGFIKHIIKISFIVVLIDYNTVGHQKSTCHFFQIVAFKYTQDTYKYAIEHKSICIHVSRLNFIKVAA